MYVYAEIEPTTDADGQERLLSARKVVAWCCRELGVSASMSTLRWFVARHQADGRAEPHWLWTNLAHVKVFTHDTDVVGLCGSPSEIWVKWGRSGDAQAETVVHEMLHMAARQRRFAAGEELVTDYGRVSAARIDWEQATQDYIDWLADPDRWAREAQGRKQAGLHQRSATPRARSSATRQAGVYPSRMTPRGKIVVAPRASAALSSNLDSATLELKNAQAALAAVKADKPCGMECMSTKARAKAGAQGTSTECCSGNATRCAGSREHGESVEAAERKMSAAWRARMSGPGADGSSITGHLKSTAPASAIEAYERGNRIMAARRAAR